MKKEAFIHPSLASKKLADRKKIRSWSRASTISEALLSKRVEVYNGKTFTSLVIQEEMIGYRLGEFARTKKRGPDPRPKFSSRRSSPGIKRSSPLLKAKKGKKK